MANYGYGLEEGAVLSGILTMRPMDSNEPMVDLGNATLLVTNVSTKTTERLSRRKGTKGLPLDSATSIDTVGGKLTIDTLNRTTYALATMGADSDFIQASGTDQQVTLKLYERGYMELGKYKVSNVRVTGAVEGTDFEVLPDSGQIKLLPGGGLDDGQEYQVTFNCAYIDGYQIDAGTVAVSYVQLRLDGVNEFGNKPFVLDIPKATLSPDGDLNWISDEVVKAGFSIKTLLKQGEAGMYRMRTFPRATQTP